MPALVRKKPTWRSLEAPATVCKQLQAIAHILRPFSRDGEDAKETRSEHFFEFSSRLLRIFAVSYFLPAMFTLGLAHTVAGDIAAAASSRAICPRLSSENLRRRGTSCLRRFHETQ